MAMTDDQIAYLGKVADWLKSCPDGQLDYGEFFVSRVTVAFDGEEIGHFCSDDPSWMYYDGQVHD